MNTIYLEYFVEVVVQKSINKAAQNLNISRTSIMAAISNLEKEIGFPLLTRTNKGVELTVEGETVYHDSLYILDITNSWSQIKRTKDTITEINFFTVPAIGLTYCMDIIYNFQAKYENYKINNSSVLNSIDSIAQALRYKNSIVFGAYYETQKKELSLLAKKDNCTIHELFSSNGNYYCNKHNKLLEEQPLSPDKLKDIKIIISPLMNNSIALKFIDPKNLTYVDTLSQIMLMLSKDKHYVSMFSSLLETYPNAVPSDIVQLESTPELQEKLNYALIYPKKIYQVPEIKQFIDFITHYNYANNTTK